MLAERRAACGLLEKAEGNCGGGAGDSDGGDHPPQLSLREVKQKDQINKYQEICLNNLTRGLNIDHHYCN